MYAVVFPYTNPDNWERDAQSQKTLITKFKLTEYIVPEPETINLLNSAKPKETEEKKKNKDKAVTHLVKRLKLLLLSDPLVLPVKDLPMDIGSLIT